MKHLHYAIMSRWFLASARNCPSIR